MASKEDKAEVTRDFADQAEELGDLIANDKDVPKETRVEAAKLISQAASLLDDAASELESELE